MLKTIWTHLTGSKVKQEGRKISHHNLTFWHSFVFCHIFSTVSGYEFWSVGYFFSYCTCWYITACFCLFVKPLPYSKTWWLIQVLYGGLATFTLGFSFQRVLNNFNRTFLLVGNYCINSIVCYWNRTKQTMNWLSQKIPKDCLESVRPKCDYKLWTFFA